MKGGLAVQTMMRHAYMTAEKCNYTLLNKFAQEQRVSPTEAEKVLWTQLNNKQLGVKFRRQHIIDCYIVDFVCLRHKLIIEVDGKYHANGEQKEFDIQRENVLKQLGFTILRFTNEQVLCDIDNTIATIKKH